ncbi:FCD domain-containing protein [Candidatus Bipolaricaulota bacterium]|nr:FCD domain-containing protein [Candidatus Bipolaricaulota bacterium]
MLDQLLEDLSSDKYEIGDRLPTEEKLSQMMGVSRTSVREALAALRLTGVVTSRAGQGTHLRKKPRETNGNSTMEKRALTVLKENTSPEEMFEARATIEGPIASLAVEKMDDSDLEKIKKVVGKMSQAVESAATEKYISLNKRFHLSIARATKNNALKNIMKSVLSYMEEELWQEERRYYYEENQQRFRESLQIHRNLFSSLQNKDRAALSEAIKTHFNYLSGENKLRKN